ncbi:MAG: exonuclease domain-containing protein [Anaerovoracaceae bacterium]
MDYIILDMEWNQAVPGGRVVYRPLFLEGEIIQIGAVKVRPDDDDLVVVDTFEIGVRPQFYTKLNSHVRRLTGITARDLQRGLPFPQAYREFRDWCGSDVMFVIWGDNDIDLLRENMLLHGIGTEDLPPAVNCQWIFQNQVKLDEEEEFDGHSQLALGDAVRVVHGRAHEAHDALGDALSTYEVCRHLDMERGAEDFARSEKCMPIAEAQREYQLTAAQVKSALRTAAARTADKKGASRREQRRFLLPAAREQLFADAAFLQAPCPRCGGAEEARLQCNEWVSQGSSGHYLALAVCPHCGARYFVRLRLRCVRNELWCASRRLYPMNDAFAEYYRRRAERQREREERMRNHRASRSEKQRESSSGGQAPSSH